MLPLDVQTNYGNLELVVKEVNKIQNLADQINYNGSVTLEKFAKEIYEKIIETNDSKEKQAIEDRKKEDEYNKKKRKKKFYIRYLMTEEEMKKKLNSDSMEEYKGKFVNLFK